jgi:ribose transport system substrate-binding protein
MFLRRTYLLLSTLLILVFITAACGGQRGQKASVPSPEKNTTQAEATSSPTQPPLSTDATQGIGLPTDLPPAGISSTPGITGYHYPQVLVSGKQRPFRVGLLARIEDPFFITLAHGAQQAAINLDVELYPQLPQNGSSAEQIQMLDSLLARGDLDALLLTPVDAQALMPALQKAAEAGILIITIQTGLAGSSSVTPFASITTDDRSGGFLTCQALAQVLALREEGTEKTPVPPKKVYIQRGKPGLFDPGERLKGCEEAFTQAADILSVGIIQVDDHEDDPGKASQQIQVVLAGNTDLSGIICLDAICTRAASQALANQGLSGRIKLAAIDAVPESVELLRQGAIDILATPKPYAMGYLAAMLVTATLDGVTGLPANLSTGWEIITPQNMADPVIARWYYDARTTMPQRTSAGLGITFIAGIDDPFYYNMQRGAQQAASSLGATLDSQFPRDWSAAEQAQIIDAFPSSHRPAALLLVPTDPLALIPSLQPIASAGVPILALDTTLDVSFAPLATISSNDQDGGYFACRSLAQAIGGGGKIYIQSVAPGIPATDARELGCQRALSEFAEITLVAVNYNDDDPARAQTQLATILQNYPDLSAVFCTNVLGAQAVGQYLGSQGLSGKVKVAAFDATATAADLLRSGIIDMVVAQKPADMGYLGVLLAAARLDGITDLPAQVFTGFVLLTRENMEDPAYARYFYLK